MAVYKKVALGACAAILLFASAAALLQSETGARFRRFVAGYTYTRDVDAIAARIAAEGSSDRERVAAALAFVAGNSTHEIDDWHDEHSSDSAYVLHLMWSHANEESDFLPHLSCGPRAIAMQVILDELGITSRRVQVYSDDFERVKGHRFLEVFMEDRQGWEIWDPDYNVVWRDEATGTLASVSDLVLGDMAGVVPVPARSRDGKSKDPSRLVAHYFEAVLFESDVTGMRDAVILYNPVRFDPATRFPKSDGMSFDEWARHHYGAPRLVPSAVRPGLTVGATGSPVGPTAHPAGRMPAGGPLH